MYIDVTFPLYHLFPYDSFSIIINGMSYGALPDETYEAQINQYTNPDVIRNEPGMQVKICSFTHCIYENSNLPIYPALQAKELSHVAISFSEE